MWPEETLLYQAHVHPVVMLRGLTHMAMGCALAWWWRNGPLPDAFVDYVYWAQQQADWLTYLIPVIAALLLLSGLGQSIRAAATMLTTRLAVTDRRIIARMGWTDTVTMEIDRHKIAGVVVYRPLWGKILGYGYVILRGYSGYIGNLPPLVAPQRFQQYVNAPIPNPFY